MIRLDLPFELLNCRLQHEDPPAHLFAMRGHEQQNDVIFDLPNAPCILIVSFSAGSTRTSCNMNASIAE